MEEVLVKKGETIVSDNKDTRLTARSLGAALAVTASDPSAGVSGMAVCILPKKTDKTCEIPDILEQMRDLFKDMVTKGARPQNMLLFLAGAAGFADEPEDMALGKKLYKTAVKTLRKNGLKITADHVGGPLNRNVSVEVGDKHLTVAMLDEREVRL